MNRLLALSLIATSFAAAGCRKISPEAPAEGYGVPDGQVTGVNGTSTGTGTNASLTIEKNLSNAKSPLGMALAAFGSATSEWISVDQMTQATDWVEIDCAALPEDAASATVGSLSFSAAGWVDALPGNGNCAATRLFSNFQGHYPAGRYLIRYEGGGTIEVSGDATTVTPVDVGESYFEVASPTTAGVLLKFRTLRPSDALRNMEIVMPGGVCGLSATKLDPFSSCSTSRGGTGVCNDDFTCYDFADVLADRFDSAGGASFTSDVSDGKRIFFHPVFLATLKRYRALNFRRWMGELGRPSPVSPDLGSHVGWLGRYQGVPWDLIVALSNVVQADPWVTIPPAISDATAGEMAALFEDKLETHLKPYVELGGEFWASSPVNTYFTDLAVASSYATYEAAYVSRLLAIANVWNTHLSAERVQIVGTVSMADSAMPERLSVMLSGMELFDVFATSLRFDLPVAGGTDSTSMTQLFDAVNGVGGSVDQVDTALAAMRLATVPLGKPLVAYGSGPALTTALTSNDARETARQDARMTAAMIQNLDNWKARGGQLIFHDKSADDADEAGVDAWGALDYQQDSASRIKAALDSFIRANACWWGGC